MAGFKGKGPECHNVAILYTLFIIFMELEVSCVFVWDHAHWLGQKLNTQNLYLQMDDKRCRLSRCEPLIPFDYGVNLETTY